MPNQELRKFVASIIEEKKLTGVEQEIKDKLIDDITVRLDDQINRALIDSLNDNQFAEFEQLVNAEDTQKLGTFFTDNKVPVQEITARVLTKFRISYLGS